jgi:hypothetical protein
MTPRQPREPWALARLAVEIRDDLATETDPAQRALLEAELRLVEHEQEVANARAD